MAADTTLNQDHPRTQTDVTPAKAQHPPLRDRLIEAGGSLLSIGFFQAASIGIDWMFNGTMTWSRYVIAVTLVADAFTLWLAISPADNKKAKAVADAAAMPTQRDAVQRVVEYRDKLEALAKRANGFRKQHLGETANAMREWELELHTLADNIDAMRNDALINQDHQEVPGAIAKLVRMLKADDLDDQTRQRLEDALAARNSQLETLDTHRTTLRNAEALFEASLSSIGTLYSQAIINNVTREERQPAELVTQVNDRLTALRDQLSALDEIRANDHALSRAVEALAKNG
jgi:hypothetical protein